MRRKKIEHLSHVLCVFSQFFLLAIELRRICCFCLLKILISHLNAMNCSVYVYTYTIYVSMQLAAYLCVCVCVCVYGYFMFGMLSFPPHVCCHLLVCPRTSHFATPPDCISSKPNRTEAIRSNPIRSSPAQLSSADC